MVGPINVKWKITVSVGYWVNYLTLTFDLIHDLDLGCFEDKFRISCISEIVGLINVKWKGSELIGYWDDCMTLTTPMTSTLEFKVEVWNSLVSGMVRTIDMERKGCESSIYDEPDSDRGDFRRRPAVDISCYWLKSLIAIPRIRCLWLIFSIQSYSWLSCWTLNIYNSLLTKDNLLRCFI